MKSQTNLCGKRKMFELVDDVILNIRRKSVGNDPMCIMCKDDEIGGIMHCGYMYRKEKAGEISMCSRASKKEKRKDACFVMYRAWMV